MTLAKTLQEYIQAAFSGIWIETQEPSEAQREILVLAAEQEPKWSVQMWDCDRGIYNLETPGDQTTKDPHSPLKTSRMGDETEVRILHNYHRFLPNPMVVQALFNAIAKGKVERTFFVILSPSAQLPPELEKTFVVLEHKLPDSFALENIANNLDPSTTNSQSLGNILKAASGLTHYEAEGAFALSLVRQDKICPEAIWEIKEGMLKKSQLLTLHRGKENFSDLGGLNNLKAFSKKIVSTTASTARPKGILLLGVPGTGKSAFAKALGEETGRKTVILDPGACMGSLVGQTEENMRRALRTVDAMQPCILFIDEVEKALSGSQSSGQTDSGVTARMFGAFLTWLNDHESEVFTVCTSNDISKLPPEFTRAERFDGIFFLDLPDRNQRCDIFVQYRKHFQIPDHDLSGDDREYDNWTGAEIKSCCRLAALLGIPLLQAADYIVPVATTAKTKVQELREWASGRCLDPSKPGIYQHTQTHTNGQRRSIRK